MGGSRRQCLPDSLPMASIGGQSASRRSRHNGSRRCSSLAFPRHREHIAILERVDAHRTPHRWLGLHVGGVARVAGMSSDPGSGAALDLDSEPPAATAVSRRRCPAPGCGVVPCSLCPVVERRGA
ncbi:unnamed protein product [Urochloa humidicola]